jgi:hypothetical protein
MRRGSGRGGGGGGSSGTTLSDLLPQSVLNATAGFFGGGGSALLVNTTNADDFLATLDDAAAYALISTLVGVGDAIASLETTVANELVDAMGTAADAACLEGCLILESAITSECATALVDATANGVSTLAADPTAVVEAHCSTLELSGHLSYNQSTTGEADAAGEGGDGSVTPATRAEQRFHIYEQIRASISTACNVISFVLSVCALRSWRDFDLSSRLAAASYLVLSCTPFVIAVLPWYSVVELEAAIRADHAPLSETSLSNQSAAAAAASPILPPEEATDALASLLIMKDQSVYRMKIAADVAGSLFGFTLALSPALLKASIMWKHIVPQSSIWGHIIHAIPYLTVLTCLAGYSLYHQLLSDVYFALFVFFSCTSSAWYSFFSTGLNLSAMRTDEGLPKVRKAIRSSKNFSLATLIVGYAFLIPYLVALVTHLSEAGCQAKSRLGTGASRMVAEFITIDSILLWTVQFYVGYYAGILVCSDLCSRVILSLHGDGFGNGSGFVGLNSVVARLMSPPPANKSIEKKESSAHGGGTGSKSKEASVLFGSAAVAKV